MHPGVGSPIDSPNAYSRARARRPREANSSYLLYFVTAIAQRLRFSDLTAAEKDFLGFQRLILHRYEICTLVGAIAKRLRSALAASAPEI